MKLSIFMMGALAILASCISGCGDSHYAITSSAADFEAKWNGEVGAADALKVHRDASGNYLDTTSGVIIILFTPADKSWIAIATSGEATDLMCTNLLLSASTVDYDTASLLIRKADDSSRSDAGSAIDGDLQFSIDRSAGGGSCTVEPAPKQR